MCFRCWAHIEKEENEITKHLRVEHGERVKKGHTLYDDCKIIPEQVAVDLTDQETVDWLYGKNWDVYNEDPKSDWATIDEIKTMYRDLNRPVPTWVDDFVLPPTGDMEEKLLVDIDEEDNIDDEEDGDVSGGDDGNGEGQSSDGATGQGEDGSENENGNQVNSSDGEMADAPGNGANETGSESPSNGTEDLEGETDGPAVYLPLIARGPELEGPLPPLNPAYKVYSCYKCVDVHGHLETMFLHYNAKHNDDLQARFAKVYSGRYFLHLARDSEIDGEEFFDKIQTMKAGPNVEGIMSEYYMEDKWGYRCYLCGNGHAATQDFHDFDEHFATRHMEQR